MSQSSVSTTTAPAVPITGSKSDSDTQDRDLLVADRVEQLYSQLPVGILGSGAVGLLATYELWDKRLNELVLWWWGSILLITIVSAGLYFVRRRSALKSADSDWLRWLGMSALASGAAWGYAGAMFFPQHTDEQQIFLAFVLTGMVSAGISVYAGSWRIYAIYAAGTVVPFTYALASTGNRLFLEIALLVPFYYAINVAVAYRLNQVFDAGFRLRLDYGRLTQDYSRLNQRLETQLVELEEARRQVEASGRKLALFAERAPISVIELDVEGNIIQINRMAELLFGYIATEIEGRHSSLLVHDAARQSYLETWQRLVATLKPVSGVKFTNVRRDGVELICEWAITPLVNTDGKLLAVIAQGQDITRQLEAERMKTEFTSTLSHELRTPLTSIIGSLQLINSGIMGAIDKDVEELTSIAERNGQRLLDLINDILDIEKIASGKLELTTEVCVVGDLVSEAMVLNQAFALRFQVSFRALGEFPQARARADKKRMLQIMTNLLSNAAKFSGQGSAVEVSVSVADGRVLVSVHDRGEGIPENFRNRIFSRFAQADSTMSRQQGGTGLGLAISKRLVELMGGRIGFHDRVGGGTTFWFELPEVSDKHRE